MSSLPWFSSGLKGGLLGGISMDSERGSVCIEGGRENIPSMGIGCSLDSGIGSLGEFGLRGGLVSESRMSWMSMSLYGVVGGDSR